jgi:hypothetical protein
MTRVELLLLEDEGAARRGAEERPPALPPLRPATTCVDPKSMLEAEAISSKAMAGSLATLVMRKAAAAKEAAAFFIMLLLLLLLFLLLIWSEVLLVDTTIRSTDDG